MTSIAEIHLVVSMTELTTYHKPFHELRGEALPRSTALACFMLCSLLFSVSRSQPFQLFPHPTLIPHTKDSTSSSGAQSSLSVFSLVFELCRASFFFHFPLLLFLFSLYHEINQSMNSPHMTSPEGRRFFTMKTRVHGARCSCT